MTRRFRAGALQAAGLLFALMGTGPLYAQYGGNGGNGGGCASCAVGTACGAEPCRGKCPPPVIHYFEGPPRLKFKKACPRPICDPCHLPHYGYYQTCWAPWPFPPDWSHCPVPPPGAVLPPPAVPPYTPRTRLPDTGRYRDYRDTDRGPADRGPADRGPLSPPSPLEKKPDPELPPPKPLDLKPMEKPKEKPAEKPEEKPMVRIIN